MAMSLASRTNWAASISPSTGLRKRYLDAEPRQRYQRTPDVVPFSLDARVRTASNGPDIEWNPCYETYLNRVERLSKSCAYRPQCVPKGYPSRVDAPWVWSGPDLGDDYVFQLSTDDVAEIDGALQYFKHYEGYLELDEVSPSTFPLPNLERRLRDITKILHSGIGFSVVRGLDPGRYSAPDNVIIYLGITSYIAENRGVQNSSGNMLIHVKDLGDRIPDSALRQSPYAHNAQPFHNDVCDILAMYVLEQAAEGGESHLASCAKVYNEIAATRPDVIQTLAEPNWVFDKHQTPAYWNKRALLFNFEGKGPGLCFSRRPITGSPTSPRSLGVPPMTEMQAEALDMVHFTAMKHKITMRLERGDIQLVNNLAIQHARNAFRDGHAQKRHIIRLWLRNEELAWKTPDGLRNTWFEKYGDSERRKIARWNIFPGATRERVLFRSDSCS